MDGYDFTQNVRTGLVHAREEAAAMGDEFVAPHHVLLGILRVPDALCRTMLIRLVAEPYEVPRRIRAQSWREPSARTVRDPRNVAYTSAARKVLELAMSEANALNHTWVGTEHLFMGVVRHEQNLAAEALRSFGVTTDTARAELLALIGGGSGSTPSRPQHPEQWMTAPVSPVPGEQPAGISIAVRYASGAVVGRAFSTVREVIDFLEGK